MAIQSDHEFAPTQIARAVFPTAFRGYDQDAVRRYLSRLAAALEHQQEYAGLGELEARTPAHERVEELENEIENLQDEIKALELELVQRSVDGADLPDVASESSDEAGDGATFDEHRAIELLGKETARVLESARSAASDILKRAETQAASLKSQAKSELAEARKRADALLSQKQVETEEMTIRMVSDAEASAQRVTAEADEHRAAVLEESSKILTEAEELSEAEQAEAEERAKQIVADAETLRQQVIAELVVERRDAQSELDRVAGARDRLAMSLAVARSELDEVADALVDSLPPAAAASNQGADSKAAGNTKHDADFESDSDSDPATGPESAADVSSDSDLEAEVDGLIESLEADPEPQELDLGLSQPPEEPANKPGPKKKRRGKSQDANGAGKASKTAGYTGQVERNGGSKSAKQASAKQDSVKQGPVKQGPVKQGPAKSKTAAKTESKAKSGSAAPVASGTAGSELADTQDTVDRTDSDSVADAQDTASSSQDSAVAEEISPLQVDEVSTVDVDGDVVGDGDPEADEVGSVDDVQVININPVPEEGEELSLVEGFTTLDVTDLERGSNDEAEQVSDPIDPTDTERGAENGVDLTNPYPGDIDLDSADADELDISTGDEDKGLVYSVLVNEPQSPDEVITTVASRIATAQRDRTRGDLLIEEAFTGRLPKQFAARDVALTRSGPNFRRQLRRALNDDQSDVLDRLRAGRGTIKVEELPTFGDQIDRYLAPLRRGLAEIAQAGARAGGQSDLSQSALDNLVRQLAKYIVDKVRVPTIQVVEETSDNDRERILEPIRALYRDFRNVGLPDLTEDALYEAFAIGLYDSIEPSAPVRWNIDPRSDPDPVCEINKARDDVAKGEVFPSGHARPLSLPGCRCLVTVARY